MKIAFATPVIATPCRFITTLRHCHFAEMPLLAISRALLRHIDFHITHCHYFAASC